MNAAEHTVVSCAVQTLNLSSDQLHKALLASMLLKTSLTGRSRKTFEHTCDVAMHDQVMRRPQKAAGGVLCSTLTTFSVTDGVTRR